MATTRNNTNGNGNTNGLNYARAVSYEQVMALAADAREQAAQSALDNGRELATAATAQIVLGVKGIHDSAVQCGVGVLLARASEKSLEDATATYHAVIAAQKKASNYGLNYANVWFQTFMDVCGQLVPDTEHENCMARVASCRAVKYTELEDSGLMGFELVSNTKLNKAFANYWQTLRLIDRLDNAPTFQQVQAEKEKAEYAYMDAYKDFERILRRANIACDVHSTIRNIVRRAMSDLDTAISSGNK